MALLIEKNMTVLGDIDLSQLYVRLTVQYGPGGASLITAASPFASKVAYDADPVKNAFRVEGIPLQQDFVYDRITDGSDILTFAHNKFKEYLTTDMSADQPLLDPSTGEIQYDPSTGEVITESVIVVPKFTFDSYVSLV